MVAAGPLRGGVAQAQGSLGGIHGTVRDDQGQALAGQTVNLLWMGMPYGSQPTTINGSYSFSGLTSGSYTVTVVPAPPNTYNPPNPQTVQLATGEQRQLDFTLQVLGGGNGAGNEYLAVVWHHDWGPQWPGSHKVAVGGGNTQVAGDRNPPDYGMFLYFVVVDPSIYRGVTPRRLTITRLRDGAVVKDNPTGVYTFMERPAQLHPSLPGAGLMSDVHRSHGMLDGNEYTNGDYRLRLEYGVLVPPVLPNMMPTLDIREVLLTVTLRNPMLEPVSEPPFVLWNPDNPNAPGPPGRTMSVSVPAIQHRPVQVTFEVHTPAVKVEVPLYPLTSYVSAVLWTRDDWSDPIASNWEWDGQANGQPADGGAYPWDAKVESASGMGPNYRLDRRASDYLTVLSAEAPPQLPVLQAEYLGHDPGGAGGAGGAGSQRFRLRYRLRATADPRQASGGLIRLYKPDLTSWAQALTTEQLAASADGTVYDWTIEVPAAEMSQHGWYRFIVLVQDAHQDQEVAQRVKWALPAGVAFATVGVPVRVVILKHKPDPSTTDRLETESVLTPAQALPNLVAAGDYWRLHLVYMLDAGGDVLNADDIVEADNPVGVYLSEKAIGGETLGSYDDDREDDDGDPETPRPPTAEELALLGSPLRWTGVLNVFYVNTFESGFGNRGFTYQGEQTIVLAGFWQTHGDHNLDVVLAHELGHIPLGGDHTAEWRNNQWVHNLGYGFGVDTAAEFELNLMRAGDLVTQPAPLLLTIEQVLASHADFRQRYPAVQP